MDFVDLDKVLDDFEEDEERISVCVVENEANANGYGHGPNTTKTYSISITDNYSNVPYPQQVSNDAPTPDSPLYNSVYGLPFKVTDNLTLSDADFGFSEKFSGSLKDTQLDLVKEEQNSTDESPDTDSLGQLFQSNGVLEIRDLRVSHPTCSTLPSATAEFPQHTYCDSVVANISPQESIISTDTGSVQSVDKGKVIQSEDLRPDEKSPTVNNHLEVNQCHASNENTVCTNLPNVEEKHPTPEVVNFSDSSFGTKGVVEPAANGDGHVCNSANSSNSFEENANNVVGFEECSDNLSDAEIMSYLDGTDSMMESSSGINARKVEPDKTADHDGTVQGSPTDIHLEGKENSASNSMDVVMENTNNNVQFAEGPGATVDNMPSVNLTKQSLDTSFDLHNAVQMQSTASEFHPVSDLSNAKVEGGVEKLNGLLDKPNGQEDFCVLQSKNNVSDERAQTQESMDTSSLLSEDSGLQNSVEQTETSCTSVIPSAVNSTGLDSENVSKPDHLLDVALGAPGAEGLMSASPRAELSQAPKANCPGVKPKEPQRLKRPSSLLGLSTVSLQPVINVPKSQSLPRSFALGATDSGNIVKKVNKTLETVPTNSCQDFTSNVNDNSALMDDSVDAAQAVKVENSNTIVGNSVAEVTPQLGVMPEEAVCGSDNTEVEHAMQTPVPREGQLQTWGAHPGGGLHEASTISREGRPESLNLPPFLGFPSHLPDTNSMERSQQGRHAHSSDSTDGPPSYGDLEDSDVGAVGGAPANPRTSIGSVAPKWVPDAEAPNCMQCDSRFTFTKRRHHCRACGKVFCSTCCNLKCKLDYMGSKEARVCVACHEAIVTAQSRSGPTDRSPNPNNPSEYCSTIPPHQQANAHTPAPTVLVPVGVLKREGSQRRGEPKQVMFSDGIRPGGDLTEADGVTEARLPQRSGRKVHKVEKISAASGEGQAAGSRMKPVKVTESSRWSSLIPAVGLPPLVMPDSSSQDDAIYTNPTDEKVMQQIQSESAEPVVFMINPNLQCRVTMVNLDCCVHRQCWCFTSKGLCTVGQDEVVIVLECLQDETTLPMDIFHHLQSLYESASKGNTVSDMGHTIFCQSFLGSKDHGGFLYIRPSFQCLLKLALPNPPYVFAILLQKWEIPWAKVFPIRLLLRLGAEYRYYPCPLISIRNRKPVFFEIGHTIMNLLADFRSYQYMLPQVKGLLIHMEDKKTVINFPRNRYQDLMKVVTGSNEHVMALGANFSMEADSHLVCIQNDDGNYQTQAINIQNKPRKVTGASFVVFNGALKTASGLTAKSSIVEDGLMVQIPPDSMAALKQSIKDMKNYSIACGSVGSAKPDEVITIQWVEDDKTVNVGVKSPVDSMSMDGIESLHIHNGTDYLGENRVIRWTEVFFIQNKDSAKLEPIDLSRLAESLAQAGCIALTPHLDQLNGAGLNKIGLRATIHSDSVGYEVGSNGEKLPDMYMNDLDNELIPVIHNAASLNQEGPITLELIFYILS